MLSELESQMAAIVDDLGGSGDQMSQVHSDVNIMSCLYSNQSC